MRRLSFGLAVLIAFSANAQCAPAPEQVKIGIGYGLAFLPFYICEDLKLVEKYAKAGHLDIKASYPRFLGSGPMQDAIGSGAIDMAPFGTAPLLAAWQQDKDTPQQIVIVSGITTMPLTLVSDRPNVASISDLGPTDRIAMPSLTAPQMFVLQMQAAKTVQQVRSLRRVKSWRCRQRMRCPHDRRGRDGDCLFCLAALHAARAPRRQGASGSQFCRCIWRQGFIFDDGRNAALTSMRIRKFRT